MRIGGLTVNRLQRTIYRLPMQDQRLRLFVQTSMQPLTGLVSSVKRLQTGSRVIGEREALETTKIVVHGRILFNTHREHCLSISYIQLPLLCKREFALSQENRTTIAPQILHQIFQESPEAILVADLEGRVLFANPTAQTLLKLQGVAQGKNLQDLLPPTERNRLLSLFGALLRGYASPVDLILQAQPVVIVEAVGQMCEIDDDLRVILFLRNVTFRRSDEESFRAATKSLLTAEAQLRSLIDHANELIFVVDPSGVIERANPAAHRTLGVPAGSLTQVPFEALFHEDAQQSILDGFSRVLVGESFWFEAQLRGESGRWIESSGGILGSNEDLKIFVIARDITERREKEQELHSAKDALESANVNLQGMVDSLDLGVLMLDKSERTLVSNELGRQYFKEICTCTSTSICALHRLIREALQKQTTQRNELQCNNKTYAAQAQQLSVQPGYETLVVTLRDVTEERSLARAMVDREKMASVGMLAAGVAHEINNPAAYVLANLNHFQEAIAIIENSRQSRLNALLSLPGGSEAASQIAKKEKADDVEILAQDLPQIITESVDGIHRIRDIVRDLKSFARPQDENVGPVDISRVLDSVLQMAASELRARCTVIKSYGSSLPFVLGHQGRLAQVFLNLVVNAAQAMDESKRPVNRLTLQAEAREDRVLVHVIDNGKGISPEVIPRIFEPFFTTKEIGQGTGLGLAISRDIIQRHGGQIAVQSAPSKGTTFTVSLPCAEQAVTKSQHEEVLTHKRARLLFIDDEQPLLLALQRALQGDHQVDIALGGLEGIQKLQSGVLYDIIFCDLLMPDVPGMMVYQAALTRPEVAKRFVFTTGGAFTAESRAFLSENKNPKLEKPLDIRDLRQFIQRHLA
jgi:PAS domain S-box-containing protein